jgi:YD repeat-containing protein
LIGSLTDANNNTTTFTPDGFDRLSSTAYPDGSAETYSRDADGNVLTRKTRANATITFAYDTLNRLSTKTPPAPETAVNYTYDLDSYLIRVSDGSAPIASPASSASYATNLKYDQVSRPISVSWSPVQPQAPPAVSSSVNFGFSYDATNRRISQSASDNSWWSYPATPTNIRYTPNNLNQYTSVGSVNNITYDGNGNLTYDGTFTYIYDAENRLISATGTGLTASYAYDALGRRKSKTVNGTTTIFVTDANNREVLEYNGSSGAIGNWYSYGPGPNNVLNQMKVASGTRATFIPDIQGSFIGTLDAASGT